MKFLVAPSDHLITNKKKFHEALKLGLTEVSQGKIVTFGIPPTRPETGFGYLKFNQKIIDKPVDLVSFIEKPSQEKAEEMLKSGNFLWNSGIFMFRVKDMLDLFKKITPELFNQVKKCVEAGFSDLGFFRLSEKFWGSIDPVSIDYAIMEKASNLSVVPFHAQWSDMGEWNSVAEQMELDPDGVCLSKNAFHVGCSNSIFRSEHEDQVLVGIGVDNIIAVAMPDAVLVLNKNKSQKVKK